MKLKVLPYKAGSASAKELVRSLSPLAIIKRQRTPFTGRKKVMLNWGHSNPAFNTTGVTILNKPSAVAAASNKLTALNKMREAGVSVPEFTNDIAVAREWIEDEKIVLCRTLLRANSGRGITVAKTLAELITAPLYVKYIRKEKEYRLHVFQGKVIDLVEKRRRSNFVETNSNKYVRSYENGWVMCRDNVTVSDATKAEAIKAVAALGLDFGAVDIVIRKREQTPVVLEVNTAPGIMGTTLESYKTAVTAWLRSLR